MKDKYLKRNLPKTRKNLPFGINSMYEKLNIIKWENNERIELNYETISIEDDSKLEKILDTFEKFYDTNVTILAPRKRYDTPQFDKEIAFNIETEYFLKMGINYNKPCIYFTYNKDNQKIREVVSDFVFMMLEK